LAGKWLIVGLGNPGLQYEMTRHNAGFMAADKVADGSVFREAGKLEALKVETVEMVVLKPQTYMNESGRSVAKALAYYGIAAERLIVLHDDLDLQFGDGKVSFGKGPHGHNGLLSIEREIKTEDFFRVRIGIESRDAEERRLITGQRYVLRKLNYEEKKLMQQGVLRAIEGVRDIMQGRYGRG